MSYASAFTFIQSTVLVMSRTSSRKIASASPDFTVDVYGPRAGPIGVCFLRFPCFCCFGRWKGAGGWLRARKMRT